MITLIGVESVQLGGNMVTSILLIVGLSCVLSCMIMMGISFIAGRNEMSKNEVMVLLIGCIAFILALISSFVYNYILEV